MKRLLASLCITVGLASGQNGIYVGPPKTYDDTSLELMLKAARARLAQLQAFDDKSIQARYGGLSGGELNVRGFAIQAGGPPIPETTIASKGATRTVAPTGTTTTDVATDTTTKTAQQNVSVPAAPAASLTLPAGMGVSASDLLNEQLQVQLEITNLQLLLEGSLTDRFVSGRRDIKPRQTLGFPITISPTAAYRNAAAFVEVTITNPSETLGAEPPSVTTLLPREKTYNVAALTDRMNSVGAGLVTGAFSVGGSYFWGSKRFYVVQDQDTIASMVSEAGNQTVFQWQFRPVLGHVVVREGLRQTFVQLALPILESQGCRGDITIRTYWRKYDRKKNVLKEMIAGSAVTTPARMLRWYDLRPNYEEVRLEDAGNGNYIVRVDGRFLPGTYVRVADKLITGDPALTFEPKGLRFIASAADLAIHGARLVSRDGAELDLVTKDDQVDLGSTDRGCPGAAAPVGPQSPTPSFEIVGEAQITTRDDTNSDVTIEIRPAPIVGMRRSIVVEIGGKVFGLSDSPIWWNTAGNTLTVAVPTALLATQRTLRVVPLMWRQGRIRSAAIAGIDKHASADKLQLLSQLGDKVHFLLIGSRLGTALVLQPPNVSLVPVGNPAADPESLRAVELTKAQIGAFKGVLLRKGNERPILLSIPAVDFMPAKKPEVKAKERIMAGSTEAVLLVDAGESIQKITAGDARIDFTVSKDKKSVTLLGANFRSLAAAPGAKDLVVEYPEAVKIPVTIDVVTGKIETIAKP